MQTYKVSDAKGDRNMIIASNMTEAAEKFFRTSTTEGLRVEFTGKVNLNGKYAGKVTTIK